MKKSRRAGAALLVVVAMAALGGSPAGADAGPASHVDSLSANAGASSVSVTGTATFVSIPKLVGEDGNDALVAGIGTDVTTLTLGRVAPNGKVTFTLGIADQPATLNGIPEAVAYYWDIVVTNGTTESKYELWAARSAQNAALGSINPVFRRYICTPNPTPPPDVSCGNAVTVTGRMQDGVVEWQPTASQINVTAGSVITTEAVEVSPTASGVTWGGLRLDGSGAAVQEEPYAVPFASVKVGLAPAGTLPEDVPLTASAAVNASAGTFTGALPKPAQAGSYVVVARACFGEESCGLSSTTLTI